MRVSCACAGCTANSWCSCCACMGLFMQIQGVVTANSWDDGHHSYCKQAHCQFLTLVGAEGPCSLQLFSYAPCISDTVYSLLTTRFLLISICSVFNVALPAPAPPTHLPSTPQPSAARPSPGATRAPTLTSHGLHYQRLHQPHLRHHHHTQPCKPLRLLHALPVRSWR